MAEIKSTIELIMERTRNLTMSEEDKREQAAVEFKAASNRLIQKFLDGVIDLDKFQEEFNRIETSAVNRGIAIAEAARRIDPEGDNRALLDLLRFGLGADVLRVAALLDDFRRAVDTEDHGAMDRMLDRLLKRGISGSAVIPNIQFDDYRAARRDEIERKFRQDLATALVPPAGPNGR